MSKVTEVAAVPSRRGLKTYKGISTKKERLLPSKVTSKEFLSPKTAYADFPTNNYGKKKRLAHLYGETPMEEADVNVHETEQEQFNNEYVKAANRVRRKALADEDYESKMFLGKWMLRLSKVEKDVKNVTPLDRVWFKVLDVYERKTTRYIFDSILVTTSKNPRDCEFPEEDERFGTICCFTKDFRDLPDVRRAAEILRKILKEEFLETDIHYIADLTTYVGLYKCEGIGDSKLTMYMQKADESFWIRGEKRKWQRKYTELLSFERIIPSRVSRNPVIDFRNGYRIFEKYMYCNYSLKQKGNAHHEAKAERANKTAKLILSQRGKKRIRDDQGGKWMVFLSPLPDDSKGFSPLDRAWFKLLMAWEKNQNVFDDISVSTSMPFPSVGNPYLKGGEGVICCFTRNYQDIEDVCLAARRLRGILREEIKNLTIFYKTNKDTKLGKSTRNGDRGISVYFHAPDLSFWKRSSEGKYIKIR